MINFSLSQLSEFKKNIFILILFIAASLIIFFPTLFGDPFWDDWVFIFKKSAEIFNTNSPLYFFGIDQSSKAWPVFYSILWSMVKIFKRQYIYYHMTSLLIHGVNGYLCWKILEKIKVQNALFIALFYIAHPLQLFTVGWIIQIKTILSILFFLVAINFLINYLQKKKGAFALGTFLFYSLSLLTKSTTVSLLPTILASWRFLNLKSNYRKLLFLLLIPIIAISFISATRTAWNFQIEAFFSNAHYSLAQQIPVLDRILLTPKIFFRYCLFLFVPTEISSIFQKSTLLNYSSYEFFLNAAGIYLISLLYLYLLRHKHYRELVGLNFYLITLLPFCGIIPIPIFATSNFMPYWLSIPFLGLLPIISKALPSKRVLLSITAVFAFVCHFHSYNLLHTEKVFLNSIEKSPQTDSYKIALIEHYIFTHNCVAAVDTYREYFFSKNLTVAGIDEKISTCFRTRENGI